MTTTILSDDNPQLLLLQPVDSHDLEELETEVNNRLSSGRFLSVTAQKGRCVSSFQSLRNSDSSWAGTPLLPFVASCSEAIRWRDSSPYGQAQKNRLAVS